MLAVRELLTDFSDTFLQRLSIHLGFPMTSRAATEYRYEKLTWPEINDAVDLGKICIIPVGSVEQHGPHLPLDVDLVCPTGIARGAGQALPEKILVLPVIAYGYTGHVMDFPGTINGHYSTFIEHVLDITKSLAYHGFKKILLLNGHGSNMPNLDLAARRCNLETDAECVVTAWWNLLTVDKSFLPGWQGRHGMESCNTQSKALLLLYNSKRMLHNNRDIRPCSSSRHSYHSSTLVDEPCK